MTKQQDTNKETPVQMRERLKQEEGKSNPGGAFNDGMTRFFVGGLSDMGLKSTGIAILILLAIIIVLVIF